MQAARFQFEDGSTAQFEDGSVWEWDGLLEAGGGHSRSRSSSSRRAWWTYFGSIVTAIAGWIR